MLLWLPSAASSLAEVTSYAGFPSPFYAHFGVRYQKSYGDTKIKNKNAEQHPATVFALICQFSGGCLAPQATWPALRVKEGFG